MAARLLIVDDDEANLDMLSRRLARDGYGVTPVAGGREALALLESQTYDLVLLDWMRPSMSGMEVLAQIRATKPATELPVIVVTALPESSGIAGALELGANDFISKPVDYRVAAARIQAHLALARAHREGRQNTALYRLAGQMADDARGSMIDLATGLKNRAWLEAALEGAPAALILLEPDGFARYAESAPREAVSERLRQMAARLEQALAELAMAGEYQFAAVVRQEGAPGAVVALASALQAALERGARDDGGVAYSTVSVGIAYGASAAENGALLRDAQAALRHARDRSRGRTTVFHAALRERDLEELRLEADLRHAVERQELVVHYQPKVDLEDGAIVGSEALVRWQRPGHALAMPDDFIPLAERSGSIVRLGRFVLERACRDTAELRRWFPATTVSVNVSGRQFSEPRLVEEVAQALEDAGLNAPALRLEVTETAVMHDAAGALDTMQRLRKMGVGLKLDDFGAGYSSLAYLQQFPFDSLKIDRAFVVAMDSTPEGLALVRTMISLARSLRLDVVAEGIETREQADRLRAMGCRYGQGYWFSRPVELARFRQLLAGWRLPAPSRRAAREVTA